MQVFIFFFFSSGCFCLCSGVLILEKWGFARLKGIEREEFALIRSRLRCVYNNIYSSGLSPRNNLVPSSLRSTTYLCSSGVMNPAIIFKLRRTSKIPGRIPGISSIYKADIL